MGTDQLLLENQICFRVYSLEKSILAAYKPILQTLGLTYSQYLVMLVLWEKGACTIGALCESLGLDTGTVSPLVKRMEKSGLVERNRQPADERTVVVALTEKGIQLRQEALQVPHKIGECLFSSAGGFDFASYNRLRIALDDALQALRAHACLDSK
jgi:DNA-binding MarR family transcriptional regulator